MIITREQLMAFIADSTRTDDKLMKIEKDGVTYLYEAKYDNETELMIFRYREAVLIGFAVNGEFYGLHCRYNSMGRNFEEEVKALEKKFNIMYEEYISQYNVDNLAPVTDKTETDRYKTMEQKVEEYKKCRMPNEALRHLFNAKPKQTSSKSYQYYLDNYAPMFIDYLKNGEEILTSYITDKAEKNAEHINYNIIERMELDKAIKELMQNPVIMQRIKLYKTLEQLNAKTVKITLNIDGTIFEALKIETSRLMWGLSHDRGRISEFDFTNKEQKAITNAWSSERKWDDRKITIDNIVKITYGRMVVYEKEDVNK